MSEHDRSHPQWEIPPAGGTPAPETVPPVAFRAARLPEVTASPATAAGEPIDRPRGRRRRATRGPVPRRRLVAAAVGVALVLGVGAGGIALAAENNGADRGVSTTTASDADGPGRGAPGGVAADGVGPRPGR